MAVAYIYMKYVIQWSNQPTLQSYSSKYSIGKRNQYPGTEGLHFVCYLKYIFPIFSMISNRNQTRFFDILSNNVLQFRRIMFQASIFGEKQLDTFFYTHFIFYNRMLWNPTSSIPFYSLYNRCRHFFFFLIYRINF